MRSALFTIAIIAFNALAAQEKQQQVIQKLFDNYPQEKLVLSLSKTDYVAGEAIYFKAYTLIGYEPSVISTNVYVELYDRNKKVVEQTMVPLYKGAGEGSIALPASLSEDVYYIRAYTHWMLNYGEALNYLKPIKVFNPYSSNKLSARSVSLSGAVYPEGGALKPGIASKLIVRLDGAETLPQHFTASLYDDADGKLINQTGSVNQQLAVLQFRPEAGKRYRVEVKDNAGNSKQLQILQMNPGGTMLHLQNTGAEISYTIYFPEKESGEGYKMYGTIHDEIVFRGDVRKSNGRVQGKIDTKDLPNGVLQLAVFDKNNRLAAQRLTFVKLKDLTQIEPLVQPDTVTFSPKGRNSLNVAVDTSTYFSYSIQVQDADVPSPATFISDIYLTSDFSSAIANPEWYFDQANDEKAAALDALLITEKWERFDWSKLLADELPQLRLIPESYLSYDALVTRKGKPEALKEINLLFRGSDGFTQLYNTKLDSFGRFRMEQLIFEDTMKVMYQLNSNRGSAKDITVQFKPVHGFVSLQSALPVAPFELVKRSAKDSLPAHVMQSSNAIQSERVFNEKSKLLQEVVIQYRRRTPTEQLEDQLVTGLFRTANAVLFDFINDEQSSVMSYNNILEWLNGRVAGLQISRSNGVVVATMRGGRPAMFVDEMQVDEETIASLNVSDIAMIKVIRGVFLGSAGGSEGAIAIYTKRGGMRSKYDTPDLPSGLLLGYKKLVPMFTPDYTDERFRDVVDQRSVLYRNSFLAPDGTMQRVTFYNNDKATKYRLIVNGFNASGTPVYLNKIISNNE